MIVGGRVVGGGKKPVQPIYFTTPFVTIVGGRPWVISRPSTSMVTGIRYIFRQIFGNKIITHCQTTSQGPSLPSSNYLVKTFPRIIWKTTRYRHWVIAVEEHIPSRASLYLPSGKPEQKVVFPTPDTQCMLNVRCIYLHLGSVRG